MLLRNKCPPAIGFVLLGVFLFATLASLSKTAYGAAIVVLLVLAAGLIAQRNWRALGVMVLTSGFVFVGWHTFLSSNFFTRTKTAFASQQAAPTKENFAEIEKRYRLILPSDRSAEDRKSEAESKREEQAPSTVMRSGGRRLNTDNFLAPGFSFSTEFRWCVLDDPNGSEKGTVTCHEKTMIDRTQRLFFLFKALENPTLFGHGIANFRVLALNPGAGYRLEQYNYPHDVIMELLYDAGIIGLGLLVIALMFSVAGFFRFFGRDPALLALGGFALFIFMSALAAGDFYDFRLFWFAALTWSTYTGALGIGSPSQAKIYYA
jgi:hypothetical protein